jgi:signal transduction histidine kinase
MSSWGVDLLMSQGSAPQPPVRHDRGGQARLASARGAVVRAPVSGRAWQELLFCLATLPLGLAALVFPAALTGLLMLAARLSAGSRQYRARPSDAAGFLGPVVIVVLAALVVLIVLAPWIGRGLGAAHRRAAASLLGEHMPAPPAVRGRGGGPLARLTATLRDRPGSRAVGYLAARLPLVLLEAYAALVWWGAGLANLTYPLWFPWFRNHPRSVRLSPVPALTPFGVLHIGTVPGTFVAVAAGAAMVLAAPWVTRAVVLADRWLMHALLGPGRLAQRVADLEQTRAQAVDDSAAMLRRLERDLHDGAQIRLATMAMNLGMALDKLDTGTGQSDLAVARDLVSTAHQGAKDAMAELRGLARGIHPPALDNGLADALATLAAGCPLPVDVTVDIPRRPTPAIETIAYFCAAELLANAVKHSGAREIAVDAVGQAEILVVQVTDDGRGGASPAGGSGLAGLTQRVRTVDGQLEITSPVGGPTRVTVELPLHA